MWCPGITPWAPALSRASPARCSLLPAASCSKAHGHASPYGGPWGGHGIHLLGGSFSRRELGIYSHTLSLKQL